MDDGGGFLDANPFDAADGFKNKNNLLRLVPALDALPTRPLLRLVYLLKLGLGVLVAGVGRSNIAPKTTFKWGESVLKWR